MAGVRQADGGHGVGVGRCFWSELGRAEEQKGREHFGQGFGTDALDLEEVVGAGEGMLGTVVDDVLGTFGTDAGQEHQFFQGGGADVDLDGFVHLGGHGEQFRGGGFSLEEGGKSGNGFKLSGREPEQGQGSQDQKGALFLGSEIGIWTPHHNSLSATQFLHPDRDNFIQNGAEATLGEGDVALFVDGAKPGDARKAISPG